jgi:hypothetical protein
MSEPQKNDPVGHAARPKRAPSLVLPIFGVVGMVALLILILLPVLEQLGQPSGRVRCGSNLRQIGQAMLLCAHDHGGKYPATIADLLQEDVMPNVFVCPDSPRRICRDARGPADHRGAACRPQSAAARDHGPSRHFRPGYGP